MMIHFISNLIRVHSVSVTRSLLKRLNRIGPEEDLDEEGTENSGISEVSFVTKSSGLSRSRATFFLVSHLLPMYL